MNKFWILSLFLLFGFAPSKLVKTKMGGGVTVSLPADFYPMPPDDIAQRFPSVRAPLGAYTNQDRVVDFSANISATQWPDANLEVARKFFKAGLINLYDKVDVIDEGIQEVNKKKYIFFEFESYVRGSKMQLGSDDPILKYTYIQYLVQPKRTLVFSFSCPKDQREDWQETARQMMKSVKVR
ncbi:MAG: hypothetical protein JJE09_13715 [Bacteroidia bacterium]|nr:hypothetical protein [Bacteroidia bacterium]